MKQTIVSFFSFANIIDMFLVAGLVGWSAISRTQIEVDVLVNYAGFVIAGIRVGYGKRRHEDVNDMRNEIDMLKGALTAIDKD